MDNVTKKDLQAFLREMQLITQTKIENEDKVLLFNIWVSALDKLSLIQFERAKKKLIQEWCYPSFPKPADLLKRVQKNIEIPITEFKVRTPKEIAEGMKARNAFFKRMKKL